MKAITIHGLVLVHGPRGPMWAKPFTQADADAWRPAKRNRLTPAARKPPKKG